MGISAGVGALIGGGLSAAGSIFGASKQASAAKAGISSQERMFQQAQSQLAPYSGLGMGSGNELMQLLGIGGDAGTGGYGSLSSNINSPTPYQPFNPDMGWLSQTPGYQFALGEGMKGTQNSYAARGLGSSGAALKGAGQFAEGLASQTFQQQLANYMGQQQQGFNQQQTGVSNQLAQREFMANLLYNMTGLGANAAAGQATGAIQTGQGIAGSAMNAGNAWAQGIGGAAGQIGGAVTSYPWLQQMFPQTPQSAPPWMTADSMNMSGMMSQQATQLPWGRF